MSKRELITVIAVSLAAITAGILLYRFTFYDQEFVVGKPATSESGVNEVRTMTYNEIVLNDLEGKPHYLADWQQPIQILNFWAPWCAPCRREIPALMDLQQSHKSTLQIIGLSFDSAQNVIDFKNEYPINYPVLIVQHEASQINQTFGNLSSALPYTVILNKKREIVYRHSGEITRTELQNQIDALI